MVIEDLQVALRELEEVYYALPPGRRLRMLGQFGGLLSFMGGVVELIEQGVEVDES